MQSLTQIRTPMEFQLNLYWVSGMDEQLNYIPTVGVIYYPYHNHIHGPWPDIKQ